jgi:hypothetical protein
MGHRREGVNDIQPTNNQERAKRFLRRYENIRRQQDMYYNLEALV